MEEGRYEDKREKRKELYISIILLVLSLIAVVIVAGIINNMDIKEEVSKREVVCISKNCVLYTSDCINCRQQKEIFGKRYVLLDIIDCSLVNEKCVGLRTIPTWICNNQVYEGVQTITKLKEIVDC